MKTMLASIFISMVIGLFVNKSFDELERQIAHNNCIYESGPIQNLMFRKGQSLPPLGGASINGPSHIVADGIVRVIYYPERDVFIPTIDSPNRSCEYEAPCEEKP